MTRRRKTGLLDDLLDLLILLPWWLCVLLAPISYAVLHHYAAPLQAANLRSGVVQQAVIHGLATIGQYLVPALCLLAAVISALRRKQRRGLVTDVAQARSSAALDGMSWREFEMLVGEAFRLRGYRITETGGGGADGGVDLVLAKGGEKFLVQCKQWKAYKVGVDVVRALFGVMAASGATGGFVVTSGRFTADARNFAQGRNVELIDGPLLFAMIQQVRRSKSQPAQTKAEPITTAKAVEGKNSATYTEDGVTETPSCPRCGSAMMLRTARKGANAGSQFWGCATYPDCRGTRAIESTQLGVHAHP